MDKIILEKVEGSNGGCLTICTHCSDKICNKGYIWKQIKQRRGL